MFMCIVLNWYRARGVQQTLAFTGLAQNYDSAHAHDHTEQRGGQAMAKEIEREIDAEHFGQYAEDAS